MLSLNHFSFPFFQKRFFPQNGLAWAAFFCHDNQPRFVTRLVYSKKLENDPTVSWKANPPVFLMDKLSNVAKKWVSTFFTQMNCWRLKKIVCSLLIWTFQKYQKYELPFFILSCFNAFKSWFALKETSVDSKIIIVQNTLGLFRRVASSILIRIDNFFVKNHTRIEFRWHLKF